MPAPLLGILARVGAMAGRGLAKSAPKVAKGFAQSKVQDSISGNKDRDREKPTGVDAMNGGPAEMKKLAGTMAILGVASLGVVSAIKAWSTSLVEGQRELRAYNGLINRAFAEQERGQLLRDINKANATGQSTLELTRETERFATMMQPVENLLTSVKNSVAGWAMDKVNDTLESLPGIFALVKELNGKIEPAQENKEPANITFLRELKDQRPSVNRPDEWNSEQWR